jgi:hypothetical protein
MDTALAPGEADRLASRARMHTVKRAHKKAGALAGAGLFSTLIASDQKVYLRVSIADQRETTLVLV